MIKRYLLFMSMLWWSPMHAHPSPIPPDVREGFVTVDGADLFYRTTGRGKPLVILHGGIGLSQDYLLPYMYRLAQSNLLIFYDQRACGRSTGEITAETITVKRYVEDLEAIREAFHCDTISILGHSFGGYLAMEYAIAHPERVEKLILSDTLPASSKGIEAAVQEWNKRYAPQAQELDALHDSEAFREGDEDVVERYYQRTLGLCCFNPDAAKLLNLRMSPLAAIHASLVDGYFTKSVLEQPYDLCPSLKKLKIPTLIMHGDSEHLPASAAVELRQNMPQSRLVIINHCGHFPYVESPDAYFASIEEFLEPQRSQSTHGE
jgi:proline iminopeptidase